MGGWDIILVPSLVPVSAAVPSLHRSAITQDWSFKGSVSLCPYLVSSDRSQTRLDPLCCNPLSYTCTAWLTQIQKQLHASALSVLWHTSERDISRV